MKLGLAQCCHPADGDVLAMAGRWMERASAQGIDLLVFPESLMTPYELDAQAFARAAQPLDGPFCQGMNALAARYGLWVAYTVNERSCDYADGPVESGGQQAPYNTALVVDSTGEVKSAYRKVHLFDTDFTRESDKVTPGDKLPVPTPAPFGQITIAICYDLRFPELARAVALTGADVLVYASAWVDGPRKVDQWRTLLRARAIENELFVAGLSRCDRGFGSEARDYAGHSCVFDPRGDELASAGVGEELLVAELDLSAIAAARAAMPVLNHLRTDLY